MSQEGVVPEVTLSPASPSHGPSSVSSKDKGAQHLLNLAQPKPLDPSAAAMTKLQPPSHQEDKKEEPEMQESSWRYICRKENRPALINSTILILAYIGWYFCRSHLSAASADLEDKTLSGKTYGILLLLFFIRLSTLT